MQASGPSDDLQPKIPSERSASTSAESCIMPDSSPIFDWLIYAGILACSLAVAFIGIYRVEADTVAYLDLSDAVRLHRWHALFNASWFPLYPAVVAVGKAAFGSRPQYEFMAARLVSAMLGLFFVLASVILAKSMQRLMLARGISDARLLAPRTLYLWVAIFAYFFVSQDLAGVKPDALMSSFILLAISALLRGVAEGGFLPYAAVGLFGALAYWTKAFAFPVFLLLIFLTAFVNIRQHRVLGRLLFSLIVFALVAGPYVWQISAAKGRFTIGDSGSLNSAWYVNGADRINPISDFSVYHRGTATGTFNHPGELLSTSPEITYYGGDQVFGTTPQWDDFSYWSDGLKPHLGVHQTAAAVKVNLRGLGLILPMRLQVLFLIAAMCGWGFSFRRASFTDPILPMLLVLALASIASLLLVHFEARYVTFAFVILGSLFAATSLVDRCHRDLMSLHTAVLLIAGLILLYSFQNSFREWKLATQQGAQPLRGIYNLEVFSAGSNLASLYPHEAEVACMGDTACWADPYWAKFAGLKMTAIIETGNGYVSESATEGCTKLQQNPSALDLLRQKHIRAIVAEFGDTVPCSAEWHALEKTRHYFYLPI
jgi:hypothetical protein